MAAIDRSLVANLPLFAALSPNDIDDVLTDATAARYTRGTHIFEQGAEAHAFFVLLHGHVRAEKTTPDGEQIVVRYIAPGEAFGIAQAIGLKHYPATAIAVVDCLAITWPAAAWRRLVEKSPQHECAANRRRQAAGGAHPHSRNLDPAGRAAHRERAAAISQAVRPQGRRRR
jgi:CRP-like cAMP-binding protein